METILCIMVWLITIMLFGVVIALFGGFCYLIYEGIKYAYKQVVDFIERKKEEKRIKEAQERWKKLEEEKESAEREAKGRFVYAN